MLGGPGLLPVVSLIVGEAKVTAGLETFSNRFIQVFNGDVGVTWYTEPDGISRRLLKLLDQPLPIDAWWWRGDCLQIEKFERCADGTHLMGPCHLDISRIASVPGADPARGFVYVETRAMQPTGLYPNIAGKSSLWDFDWEEYAEAEDGSFITRDEYDNGSRGSGAALRARYITPYNFVIGSTREFNHQPLDDVVRHAMKEALLGREAEALRRLAEAVAKTPISDGI